MIKLKSFILPVVLCLTTALNAQYYKQASSAEIHEKLEKFNFLGTALYVAAHPDDENTRLISYLSNGLNARTAYLSITRGDGGQNLIGTEIRELLGVIRSQELQMARSVDGGQQFFTRANDFGYSKHPDETLKIWDKEKVLEDMVYVIRSFKPDVVVNRFDHRTPGRTHGHHTSSAMLALEAYQLAKDPDAYPHQLESLDTWEIQRHFFNTSWWFYGSRENFENADKSTLVPVDVGVYYPTLGLSNNEISAFARSKHRSQGFGSSGDRGNYQEYLELLRGTMPEDKSNLFEGVDTEWTRIDVGNQIKPIMDSVMSNFNFTKPSAIVPELLQVYEILKTSKDDHWRDVKLQQLSDIITDCMGLHVEASTDRQQFTPGQTMDIELEWTNRSEIEAFAKSVSIEGNKTEHNLELSAFTTVKEFEAFNIDPNTPFTNPYWLNTKGTLGMYNVENPELRTLPESPAAINCQFELSIMGTTVVVDRAVNYRFVNPAEGEIRQPIAILPPATLNFDKDLYLFANNEAQEVRIDVRASEAGIKGTLIVDVPEGWSVEPDSAIVEITNAAEEKTYVFNLISPETISESQISAKINIEGNSYNKSLTTIEYDHIPLQSILSLAEAKLVKVPLIIEGPNIAYLMGAGDKVPESLTNVGYNVSMITIDDLKSQDLKHYDAIVVGVRAYNTLDELKLYNHRLFEYAENGGTVITQYNTSRRLNFDVLAPYPIKLSRSRVTDEYAEMRILRPNHRVFNYPNKITDADFDNWVQERGLYFAEEWSDEYKTVLSCNDPGESALDGSLLIAEHGKGYFVYTSLSWFRQLPAGVPGAFRIFANLLALSQDNNRP